LKEDGALFDSGFDDTGPFRVTPESGSVSLESALRDFGPAAIDDLIPRVRAVATALDAAHRAGAVHGALHPGRIYVSDTSTQVIAGTGAAFDSARGRELYTAPEVVDGHGATPMSDQYALAAITYEWLFGRPIAHAGARPVEVRAMPGVDRSALSKAFTRALAPAAADRFASCVAFCEALNGAIVPELPLLADVEDFHAEDDLAGAPIAAAPVVDVDPARADDAPLQPAHAGDDFEIAGEELAPRDTEPDFGAIDPRLSEPAPPASVPAWNPPAAHTPARSPDAQRFGGFALILATLVGAVFGFAAGYMARPRALQGSAPQTITVAPGSDDRQTASGEPAARPQANDTSPKALQAPKAPKAPQAPRAPQAPEAPTLAGRLLVRSDPSGASVTVDGVSRGTTPLALRDLPLGTREVTVTRRGYLAERRTVAITKERPARTLDVRLSAAAAAPPRPSTPATLGRPAATTGSLQIDSRPSGASVTINGNPRGTTPLTINDLAPGEYRILMSMTGYRNLATTVRVVAGERARAAASLTALEQE
jgi:hypothetical protein